MGRSFVVCSHRGPALHRGSAAGPARVPSSPGGLVRAVRPVLRRLGGRWIAAAITEADRDVARAHPHGWAEDGFAVQLLDLPRDAHRGHYEVVSVAYLLRLFHYLYQLPAEPLFDGTFWTAWAGFETVNRAFAEAVLSAPESGSILIQDVHLLAVGRSLRDASPTLTRPLVYFHHIPWCEPDYFGLLPAQVARQILDCMLAHDVVAFNASRWARSFLACCRAWGHRPVEGGVVGPEGRLVRVLTCPVPLDVPAVRAELELPVTGGWLDRFERERAGRWGLVRVDRVDLWKNVVNGFLAFESLLSRRPELAERVWFLAVLSAARTWSPAYRGYLDESLAAAARVNQHFGRMAGGARDPVTIDLAREEDSDHARALGALGAADGVLVSSFFDGLNLVAKESVIASPRDPILLISRNAGVSEQMDDAALLIDPCDAVGLGREIERAYEMQAPERAARAVRMRQVVEGESPERWIEAQLAPVLRRP